MHSKNRIRVWEVTLLNGDFYCVFATCAEQAKRIVARNHFPDVTVTEFGAGSVRSIRRMPDTAKICVVSDYGERNWTARRWARGARSGLFCSNTYEY